MVTASQAGNASFAAAPDLTLTVNVAKAPATVSFDAASLHQVYDGTAKTVSTTTTPPGLAVEITFTGTPHDAGSYAVTATITDVNHTGSAADTLVVGTASATATAGSGTKVYGAADPALTATSSGFIAADGIIVSASRAAGENVGSYATAAIASGAALANYAVTYVAGTFSITPATATVRLGSLSQTFTGAPLSPTVSTVPAGLAVVVTGAPQTAAGSYVVTATIADPNYVGGASGTFVITAPIVTGDDDNDHDKGKGREKDTDKDKDKEKNDHRKDPGDNDRSDRNDRDSQRNDRNDRDGGR
jgi:hypothetical protein